MVDKTTGKTEVSLLEYWHVLLKRKWVIVTVTAVLLAVSGIISFTSTPIYEATAEVLIEDPGTGLTSLQDLFNSSAGNSDWMGTYFNTQLKILQSRSLAERVARKMNLANRAELRSPDAERSSLIRMIKSVFGLRWLFPAKAAPEKESPGAASSADPSTIYAGYVLAGLAVKPVSETRLVDVSFRSPYSRLATDVVNALTQEFISFSIETRFEATQQTSEFLDAQIARVRQELADKQRELQKYGDQKKIVQLNDKENSIVTQFGEQAKAYFDAQLARVNAWTRYNELRNLRVDSLPQTIDNLTIQGLRTSYVQLQTEYAEKSNTYGPNYPDLVSVKTRMDSTRTQLENEIKKAVDAAYVAYQTSLGKEQSMEKLLDDKRGEVTRMNNDNILATSLSMEIQNKQQLLNTLQSKQEETGVTARLNGLKTSNIKIVDSAVVPDSPVSPNTRRNLLVALLLGLLFGVGLAFIADYLDSSVKGPEDLLKLTGLPSLGVIPHFSTNGTKRAGYAYESLYGQRGADADPALAKMTEVELVNHLFPKIGIAEDYRTVRTAILFSHADTPARNIAFTSSSPQEGKSATLANMAISFAQLGERVLAVDADLRKPRLHKIFQVRNMTGLSGYLTGRAGLEDAVQKTAIDNLWVLPGGPHPPNPAELLNSRRMKELLGLLKEQYDIVLIDTPPVLAVIDPVIVSSLTDSTVLVLRTGKVTRKLLSRTIEELRKAKAVIIGVIFNDAKSRKSGQSSNYFQYEYYQDRGMTDAEGEPGPKGRRAS